MTILTFILLLFSCQTVNAVLPVEANSTKVNNVEEFNAAVANVKPGQTIVLANGVWKDVELKFVAKGTAEAMIYIVAEEKGKVFFEGQSNVKMGGEYVHLEGLVFRNGFSPTSEVIALKNNKETPCNNCRVTECVIDDYNPAERFDTNYWIEIYGKNNRVDHNFFVAKRNRGVTLAVRLKNENDRENNHRIDHNHFGYRPTLGSNGGETLRIGTSHYSLSNSNTLVEDNYFDRCNGELEIISSKSCQNIFKNNAFVECQGTLTMRHGNETIVENNYFIGNRKANTGGIRVINETQTVRNNYLEGLTGYRFRGALVIMNGVPDSPLNRYFQVKDAEVSNNLVVDCDHLQLCAGSDEERSATPVNTSFKNNIITHRTKDEIFTVYDDITGISFENNLVSPNILYPEFDGRVQEKGFSQKEIKIAYGAKSHRGKGGMVVGPTNLDKMPTAMNTGVDWYPKKDYQIKFKTGKIIKVASGENTLFEAMKSVEEGDVLELGTGDYHITRSIEINNTVTIKSATGVKPKITYERSPLFSMENGASLELENLNISGAGCDDYSGNSVIRTSRYSMINNYKLLVKSCDIESLDVNHSFNFLRIFKNTFADSILLQDCNFSNITGHVLNMDKEIDDRGIYNAEGVVIDNCTFKNIGGSALNLYRGGKDESTFGPMLWIKNSTFENVGNDKRNKNESAINLHGVQLAEIENLIIKDSRKIQMHLIVGDPVINLDNIKLINSEEINSNSDKYSSSNIVVEEND